MNSFLVTDLNSIPLIQMPSQFTSTEANCFKQLLQQTLGQSQSQLRKVILDFEQTTFIDKGGLIGLCQILRLARDIQADLSFTSFSPQVKMVLSLAGLESFFMTVDNASSI